MSSLTNSIYRNLILLVKQGKLLSLNKIKYTSKSVFHLATITR